MKTISKLATHPTYSYFEDALGLVAIIVLVVATLHIPAV